MNPDTNLPPTPEIAKQPETPEPTAPPESAALDRTEVPSDTQDPQTEEVAHPVPQPAAPIASPQPIYTPPPVSEMPKNKGKKKLLFIIPVVVIILAVVAGVVIMFLSKAASIGSISADSYEGLNYQRPTAWIKDTSDTSSVAYHPKASLGKAGDSKPTYALKMNVSAQKNVFQSTPDNLSPTNKSALQTIIDKEINEAATGLLPAKTEVGCDTNPVYKDKPKKVTLANSFLAVKYSFTCTNGAGSKETTFYYVVIDVVPNNKDIEYILNIGAASKKIYDSNLSKIDTIVNSVSF